MKTIRLDDEAYALLRAARQEPREGFSSIIKRVLGKSWEDSAGSWKGTSDSDLAHLRRSSVEAFGWTKPKS